MKQVYFIKVCGSWKQVSYDEYQKFEGEKEARSSTWGLMLITDLLLPYRFM